MPFARRILSSKGDLLTRNGTREVRVAIGDDGQVLTADSAEPSGLKWGAGGGGALASIAGETNLATGADLLLVCSAQGTNLHYQWRRGVTNVGTDSNTLSVPGAASGDAGSYRCEVTSNEGVNLSNALAVTVTDPPEITSETPPTQTPSLNESIDFVIAASGGAPLAYQWQRLNTGTSQWENVTGQVAATMTRTASSATQGSYRCAVSNAVGQDVSSVMFFSVDPPVITTQPTALAPTASVVATGAGTLAYLWYYGNTPIAGATDSTIDLGDHVGDLDLARGYKFKVRVSNGAGFVFSNEVGAIVAQRATDQVISTYQNASGQAVRLNGSLMYGNHIVANLMPLAVSRCDEVTFYANLSRHPGTSYAWTRNDVPVGNGDTDAFGTPIPNLTLRNVQAGDIGVYVCTATNAQGSVASDPFEIGSVYAGDEISFYPTISRPFDVKVFSDESISKSLAATRPAWDLSNGTQGHGYRGHVGVAIYSLDAADYVAGATQGSTQYADGTIPEGGLIVSEAQVTKSVTLDGATLPTHTNIRLNFVNQTWNPNADPPESPKSPWADTPAGAGWGTSLASFDCTVIERAAITAQPGTSRAVALGDSLTLEVGATGDNLEYGWWKDGERVFAQTGAQWVRETVAANDSGLYQVKAANRSTETLHVAPANALEIWVIGFTGTPETRAYGTSEEVEAPYVGTNIQWAIVEGGGAPLSGAVLTEWRNKDDWFPANNIVAATGGAPCRYRMRFGPDHNVQHETGDFTVTIA